jgi:protein-S-isoprenylcysteine O-methyltransferase Ste14
MVLGKIAFIVMVIAQIVIRYPYRSGVKHGQTDRQEQVLLALFALGSLILPLVYIFTSWLSFADYDLPTGVVFVGIIVAIAGLWLFWRAHADLGRNWSQTLDIHDDHQLVTQGVYKYIRHPMYAAGWLFALAAAFLLSNWIAGLAGLVTFGLLYFLRVPREEQMLLQEFGEPYQRYLSETGRVIPKRTIAQ